MEKGIVFLVGAGPGDPGLLTLKGQDSISISDVIVYDYLVNKTLLEFARPDAEIIYAGKQANRHTLKQDEINKLLAEKALEGKNVCRLKGGDPFLFGRGGEEALYLREQGIDFEIVPGISAAMAVPAYAGIPVTHRGYTSTFAAITGHEDPTKESSDIDWSKVATGIGTLVFFMGVGNLPAIAKNLIKYGRPASTPAALIRYGTTPEQQTVVGTLENIAEVGANAGIKPPALIVIGETVALREKLKWFENETFFGKTAVVTRSRVQASTLAEIMRNLGMKVIEFPTIKIEPPEDPTPLMDAAANIDEYDWAVFTSVNGVEAFIDALWELGGDARAFANTKVCAIGPVTAQRLEDAGLRPDVIPEKFVAESVAQAFEELGEDIAGKKFLLPRADIARATLREKLEEMGAVVTEVTAYRTVKEEWPEEQVAELFDGVDIDLVTFTSSSTAKNFVSLVGENRAKQIAETAAFASIGPVTSKTLEGLGMPVTVEAAEYTIPGLLKAVTQYFVKESKNK